MTDSKEPLLDQSVLDSLLGSVEPAAMPVLMQSLEREIGDSEAGILETAGKLDWALLEVKAHALKSATASFGAMRLSALLLLMEENARETQDAVVLSQQCSDLTALVCETREVFGWSK
ncbi:Hpt domain-containing protein [Kordiimonas aquimaris]|uniref:Hpt domain-containing protein n=1 Tax=Kordiimonas aquimaris TaxID=707591 RepID=UPI0021D2E94F|nr:Hpt domain-containing protein [Kordiimonas aquimaris]